MRDWNVLVTVNAGGWKAAKKLLRPLGQMGETPFHNVLVLRADEQRAFLDAIDAAAASDPRAGACLAHVAPADTTFTIRCGRWSSTAADLFSTILRSQTGCLR